MRLLLKEAAERYRVSMHAIKAARRAGEFPVTRIGRAVFVEETDIEAWFAKRKRAEGKDAPGNKQQPPPGVQGVS